MPSAPTPAATMGGAMTAIEQAARVQDHYDESWIIENVRRAVKLAIRFGNTHIRAFADTDTKAKLEGVKALLRAREEFKEQVEIQVVAFPQDGIVRDPGAEDYVRQAMELGADVVGGIPWIEYTDEDAQQHIDLMFAIAKEYDKDISMLVDDAGDPGPADPGDAGGKNPPRRMGGTGYGPACPRHGPLSRALLQKSRGAAEEGSDWRRE